MSSNLGLFCRVTMTNCSIKLYNNSFFTAFCVMPGVPMQHVQMSKLVQSSYWQN